MHLHIALQIVRPEAYLQAEKPLLLWHAVHWAWAHTTVPGHSKVAGAVECIPPTGPVRSI